MSKSTDPEWQVILNPTLTEVQDAYVRDLNDYFEFARTDHSQAFNFHKGGRLTIHFENNQPKSFKAVGVHFEKCGNEIALVPD